MSNDQQSPHAKWRSDVIATSEKQAKAIEKATEAADAKAETKPASKTSDKN